MTSPAETIEHYAIVGGGRNLDNPLGLVRRRFTSSGRVDEALQQDMSWERTATITQWEFGNYPDELSKVSREQAGALIEQFREKWAAAG